MYTFKAWCKYNTPLRPEYRQKEIQGSSTHPKKMWVRKKWLKIRNKQSLWFICLVSTQMGMEKRNVNYRVRNENHSTVLITWWQTRNPSGNTTSNGFINPPIKNPPFCKVKSIIYVCARLCLCVCVCTQRFFITDSQLPTRVLKLCANHPHPKEL